MNGVLECQPCRQRKNKFSPACRIISGTPFCIDCLEGEMGEGEQWYPGSQIRGDVVRAIVAVAAGEKPNAVIPARNRSLLSLQKRAIHKARKLGAPVLTRTFQNSLVIFPRRVTV